MELSHDFSVCFKPKKHTGITEPKTYGHVQFWLNLNALYEVCRKKMIEGTQFKFQLSTLIQKWGTLKYV